jgi:hypothetical protein
MIVNMDGISYGWYYIEGDLTHGWHLTRTVSHKDLILWERYCAIAVCLLEQQINNKRVVGGSPVKRLLHLHALWNENAILLPVSNAIQARFISKIVAYMHTAWRCDILYKNCLGTHPIVCSCNTQLRTTLVALLFFFFFRWKKIIQTPYQCL